MNTTRVAAALLVLLGSTTTGLAGARAFPRVDANGDGLVTPEEAKRSMKGLKDVQFRKCDWNRDGFIEYSEFGCLTGIYDTLYRNNL